MNKIAILACLAASTVLLAQGPPTAQIIPIQLAMGGAITATPPATKQMTTPLNANHALTANDNRRLAASIQRLTPKQRKQLAKSIKKMTPAQQAQFANQLQAQLAAAQPKPAIR